MKKKDNEQNSQLQPDQDEGGGGGGGQKPIGERLQEDDGEPSGRSAPKEVRVAARLFED